MKETIKNFPAGFNKIQKATDALNFDQTSDVLLGSLLSTLCASKPEAQFLELGTGSGLSTAWMLQGMCKKSTLKTIDSSQELIAIARENLGFDKRVEFFTGKGEDLILRIEKNTIDFIFADTWPGKYNHLEETLLLLKAGGLYIIDDMLAQDNWPDGHAKKAENLINYLESRDDLTMTKMSWSTGIIICTKVPVIP
ncbi:Methyltransferase type 11 [hydrothermal vent metagenome]|uniref:Methyltransferase type 11 n=1 Tax=hydrothermal vent metagenome TaxID=652676 RepID=A0A3B0YL57_9ZZZZ